MVAPRTDAVVLGSKRSHSPLGWFMVSISGTIPGLVATATAPILLWACDLCFRAYLRILALRHTLWLSRNLVPVIQQSQTHLLPPSLLFFSEKAGFNKFFPEIIYLKLIPLCIYDCSANASASLKFLVSSDVISLTLFHSSPSTPTSCYPHSCVHFFSSMFVVSVHHPDFIAHDVSASQNLESELPWEYLCQVYSEFSIGSLVGIVYTGLVCSVQYVYISHVSLNGTMSWFADIPRYKVDVYVNICTCMIHA